MRLIDGHLDLAYLALNGRDLRQALEPDANDCVTLPALRSGGVNVVFATIFTEPTDKPPNDWKPEMYLAGDAQSAEAAGLRQLAVYEQLDAAGEMAIVQDSADFCSNDRRLRTVLLMEGADPIRSPEEVQKWRRRGVRIVGLTWAAGTRYAGGNGPPPGSKAPSHYGAGPLTAQGIELIRALDDANIIHDASHLSDSAFDGLMENARGPIIASHSNCRALVNNWQRHLRDDQIKAIADRGGVIGLNLYTKFLAQGHRANIDDCMAHIEHICEVAGHRRAVALGSDADGGFERQSLPADLDDPRKWPALLESLHTRGWCDDDIQGFAHGNWERLVAPV